MGQQFGSIDFGMDSFGANDLALDYNMQGSGNAAFRFMMHSDSLENHRDHSVSYTHLTLPTILLV